MLEIDPTKRIRPQSALSHPYITGGTVMTLKQLKSNNFNNTDYEEEVISDEGSHNIHSKLDKLNK